MDSLLPDAPERNDTANRPLDRSARAAVTALARALEVFDRPAARRAALRAHLADRIAVAAGTPRLLVVRLHALRQVHMYYEPHIRFVDTHTERNGRYYDHAIVAQEPFLMRAAHFITQSGVVGERIKARIAQSAGGLLDAAS